MEALFRSPQAGSCWWKSSCVPPTWPSSTWACQWLWAHIDIEEPSLTVKGANGSRRIEIQPGMTASVDIRTGAKTVLHYLTKPITKTFSEALGER